MTTQLQAETRPTAHTENTATYAVPPPTTINRLLLYLALIALVPVAYQHLLVTGWGMAKFAGDGGCGSDICSAVQPIP